MCLNSGRLAEIMRHQAALLEHIITTQRYYPDYFRVAFYGNFPVAIRNKQFIVCCDLVIIVTVLILMLFISIAVTSGRSSEPSVNACLVNIQARSC
jgi:hypothetical protein